MSRVHDALRKAQQTLSPPPPAPESTPASSVETEAAAVNALEVKASPEPVPMESAVAVAEPPAPLVAPAAASPAYRNGGAPAVRNTSIIEIPEIEIEGLLSRIQEVPFTPSPDAHLIDATRPHEAPTEEFRTLRTRINHLQSLQPIHSLVVTSPSPAEGKSLAAVNLALAESHLASNMTLLCDFDFRRPIVHQLFQIDRSPGITDYLLGKAKLEDCIRKIAGTNLCIMPAGEAVINPLELLNLPAVRAMLKSLPQVFNWIVLDSPPLLFAADASLLGTVCDGTILVVRIGRTTVDSVTRAINSLCENNVLGIVVNGARRGELYSKYTYYHSYYYSKPE
jgi:protein-tyrosine kinase